MLCMYNMIFKSHIHENIAQACLGVYWADIQLMGGILTCIYTVVACALLLQDHLEEMYSSRPFGEDATPLHQQLQGLCTLVVIW